MTQFFRNVKIITEINQILKNFVKILTLRKNCVNMAEITKINLFSNFETFRKDLHSHYRKIVSIWQKLKKSIWFPMMKNFVKIFTLRNLRNYGNYGIQSHISNFPIYLSWSWSCHVVVWYLDQILMSSQYRLSAATSTIIKINHSSEGCQWVCVFVSSLTPPKRRTLMSWNFDGWFPLGCRWF